MAMHSSRLTQDQNFSVHFDGIKTNGLTVQKNKGGLGGRKALNDISNSGKPSALQPSRKHNTKNVVPIGEDLGVSKKPVGGKSQISGRKALGDLTNSVKPLGQQQQGLKKKSQGKQSIAVAEHENIPYSIAEEGFLHNHDECVKLQKKSFDFDLFLKTTGLDGDACFQSVSACSPPARKSKEDDNIMRLFEIEEMCEPMIEDRDRARSPICLSPDSPKLKFKTMSDFDFPSFILADTP